MNDTKNAAEDNRVVNTISDFHSCMCRHAPMQIITLAHTIVFGFKALSLDEMRKRLDDSGDVWVFPLLKQNTRTKLVLKPHFGLIATRDPETTYSAMAGTLLSDWGGVLGLAERSMELIDAMEKMTLAAIKAGRTVDEQDLLYAGVNKEKATDTTKPAEDNGPVDLKFEHGNIKARLLEVLVDKDGNLMNLPDDVPAEVKAALESRVAELRAAGAL